MTEMAITIDEIAIANFYRDFHIGNNHPPSQTIVRKKFMISQRRVTKICQQLAAKGELVRTPDGTYLSAQIKTVPKRYD
jgi:hypothetical protein